MVQSCAGHGIFLGAGIRKRRRRKRRRRGIVSMPGRYCKIIRSLRILI
jgi:hypothetical protein